jgi:transposase
MRELPLDHHCAWREEAEELRAQLGALRVEHLSALAQLQNAQTQLQTLRAEHETLKALVDKLQRHVFGQRSEKMPPMDREVRRGKPVDRAKVNSRRSANASAKRELVQRRIEHKVADKDRVCPKCGGTDLRPLGTGKETTVFEYVPPSFEQLLHAQEVLACRCGAGVITAEGAAKVIDRTQYGPGLLAHIIVSKCADSLPLYRLAKQYRRLGIPMARSTLTDLFHRGAELLAPLGRRIEALTAAQPIVQADETVIRVLHKDKCKKGYLWTFLAWAMISGRELNLIAFRFSPSRSGETPVQVLGATQGTLVVDGYTGYNAVTTPAGRARAGCMAHVRRKLFDALSQAPEAQQALDLIRELYMVEHEAVEAGVVRKPAHLTLRQTKSCPVMERLRAWLDDQRPKHLPKSAMGEAISYALNSWASLKVFLGDEHVPIDNNASERALRVAALGRKNFLFVGNVQAGKNIAALYTLVATCEANGVNPLAYLADVLIRVQTHPASRIDELLPFNWQPAVAPQPEASSGDGSAIGSLHPLVVNA